MPARLTQSIDSQPHSVSPLPPGKTLKAEHVILLAIFFTTTLLVSFNINDSTMLKSAALYCGSFFLVCVMLSRALRNQEIAVNSSPLLISFAVYVLVCVLSMSIAINVRLAAENVAQLFCYLFLFYISTTLPIENFRFDTLIGRSFAVVVLLSGAVALIEVFPAIFPDFILPMVVQDIVATFGNSTYFAGFLVLALPILLANGISREATRVERTMFIALSLATLGFIIKTGSRSAWIAVLGSLFCFAWLNFKTAKKRFFVMASLAMTILAITFMFPEFVLFRIENVFSVGPSSSISRRLFFYEGAWHAFLASPVIGHGIGNFVVVLPKYRSPEYWMSRSEDIVPHAHNEILEILTDTGMIGAVCVIAMIFFYTRTLRSALRTNTLHNRTVLVGYICGLLAVCIDNITSMNLRTIPVAVSFCMIAGISYRQAAPDIKHVVYRLPHSLKVLWLLPFLSILAFLWIYIPTVITRYRAEKSFLEGMILRASNHLDEATEKFSETIVDDSSIGMARLFLASNLSQTKLYSEARDHIYYLLKENPYYPKARIVLAHSLFELGDTAAAIGAISEELALETSPQVMYFAAYFAHKSGHPSEEVHFLQTLLANAVTSGFPDFVPDALRALSEASQEDKTHSEELVQKVIQNFSSNSKILFSSGGYFVSVGLMEHAETVLRKAQTIDPSNDEINRNLRFVQEELRRRLKNTDRR